MNISIVLRTKRLFAGTGDVRIYWKQRKVVRWFPKRVCSQKDCPHWNGAKVRECADCV